jgi:hypothetical protein
VLFLVAGLWTTDHILCMCVTFQICHAKAEHTSDPMHGVQALW